MLRGAISGFGEVAARAHLAGWAQRNDVTIVAVHDPVAARRHAAINLIRNVRVYDDLELMLAGEKLDFVDIASPPAYHAATAQAALEAGAHILIEKPLCLRREELDQLTAAAVQANRVLMCVHNWKYSPPYQRARQLVSAGRLGELEYVSMLRLRPGPAGHTQDSVVNREQWRLDQRKGGGILIDHGWHIFYLAQFLFGGARPSGISARLDYASGTSIEDFADLRLDFAGRRIAHAILSWRAPVRVTAATLYGSEAMLAIEGNRLTLTLRSGLSEDCSVDDTEDDSYHPTWFRGLASEFVAAIHEGPAGSLAQANLREAETALALILASRQSERAGQAVVHL
jgi:predicted dehydrogenase